MEPNGNPEGASLADFSQILLLVAVAVLTVGTAAAFANGGHQYVGVLKCKACHIKQYNVWKKSAHSTTFDRLTKADRGNEECASCHATGSKGETEGSPKLKGVQCEACHGPGSLYRKMTVMSKSKYRADPDKQRKLALEAGLILPTEATCKQCHNEKSPHFKGFDFNERKEEIRHWDLK